MLGYHTTVQPQAITGLISAGKVPDKCILIRHTTKQNCQNQEYVPVSENSKLVHLLA